MTQTIHSLLITSLPHPLLPRKAFNLYSSSEPLSICWMGCCPIHGLLNTANKILKFNQLDFFNRLKFYFFLNQLAFVFVCLFVWGGGFCFCLSRHAACGILVPRPRIKPLNPIMWKHGVLTTGPPGNSLKFYIYAHETPTLTR